MPKESSHSMKPQKSGQLVPVQESLKLICNCIKSCSKPDQSRLTLQDRAFPRHRSRLFGQADSAESFFFFFFVV